MAARAYWNIGDLASALAGSEAVTRGRMGLSFIPGTEGAGVLQVTLHECGDLIVVVGVAGLEIQASVPLVAVDDIRDSARFDRQLLRANKLLPLSTFGITTIEGRDWYEIFGQMSGASGIDEVLEEIETLGRNALDAAATIESWKAQTKAA